MSWIAATRSTVTSPVSTSTETSATWTPKVCAFIPAGFGPRAPGAEDLAVTQQADEIGERMPLAVRKDDRPPRARARRLGPVALRGELEDLARASAAAARTAGPIEGRVEEPAEMPANGPRGGVAVRDRHRSSGRPSSSAAIWDERRLRAGADVLAGGHDGRMPVRSRPGSRRSSAGPPAPYQICEAIPTPRLTVAVGARTDLVAPLQCGSARR